MSSARYQAKEAAMELWIANHLDGEEIADVSNAASDIWEPLLREALVLARSLQQSVHEYERSWGDCNCRKDLAQIQKLEEKLTP